MARYSEMHIDEPILADIRRAYEQLRETLFAAENATSIEHVVQRWDQLRRHLETWSALVDVRFDQGAEHCVHDRSLGRCLGGPGLDVQFDLLGQVRLGVDRGHGSFLSSRIGF